MCDIAYVDIAGGSFLDLPQFRQISEILLSARVFSPSESEVPPAVACDPRFDSHSWCAQQSLQQTRYA